MHSVLHPLPEDVHLRVRLGPARTLTISTSHNALPATASQQRGQGMLLRSIVGRGSVTSGQNTQALG